MKIKPAHLLLLQLIFFKVICNAQKPVEDSVLNDYGNRYPAEHLHLHFDKNSYLPGEIIWFKAYLLANGLPSLSSTTLYTDLLNEKGEVLQRKTMPILNATADGFFKLPDSTASYTIRAYTSWMLNFDPDFIFYKKIQVPYSISGNNNNNKASLQFFPEGGNMVAGLYNYIAFKAVMSNGTPFAIKAAVKNNKDELADSIEAVHDGMGLLKFTPVAGESYYAEWKDPAGETKRTLLPVSSLNGVLLHAEQVQNELYYNISSSTASGSPFTVVALLNQNVVYRAEIKNMGSSISQHFNTAKFNTGVLQLTLFDHYGQPVAERVVFINNNNYRFEAAAAVIQKNMTKRAKNVLQVTLPDTLNANVSLAVYDASLEQPEFNSTIYSDLLLQGDIRGIVFNAGWYFESDDPNAAKYLDLVMQTHGWRRYDWVKIQANTYPSILIKDNTYINISGTVAGGTGNPPASILLQTADSSKNWYFPPTAKNGQFIQNGLIFYDSATVYYKPFDQKTGRTTSIATSYNGLYTATPQGNLPAGLYATPASVTAGGYTNQFIEKIKQQNPEFEQHAKILDAVVVKSGGWHGWKNNPMLKMDEKYTSGPFRAGATSQSFDLLHDPTAENKSDIYNYLIDKLPLTVSYSNVGKTFTQNPLIFVNENRFDNDYLRTINISEIAYVKYFDRAYGMAASSEQLQPALAIYLKKEKDYQEAARLQPGNLLKARVYGYSPVKEFYQPDYSVPSAQPNADLRSTLLWRPYILSGKGTGTIRLQFYNNDITKKFKLVLEGMNDEGKLIRIEKVIE